MPHFVHQGIRAHYFDQGRGPAVVLIHSGGHSTAQWARLTAELESSFRVLGLDLYGHGGTDPWSGSTRLSLDDDADLIAAFIRQIGEPVALVGHSYGGAITLRVAIRYPESVRHHIMIEPQVYLLLQQAGLHDAYQGTAAVRDALFAAFDRGDVDAAVGGWYEHYSGVTGSWAALSEAGRQHIVGMRDLILGGWHALDANPTTLDNCRTMSVPSTVIVGQRTTPSLSAMSQLVAQTIPGAGLVTLAEARHMSPLTHAPDIARAMVAALANVPGQPRTFRSQHPLEVFAHDPLGTDRYLGSLGGDRESIVLPDGPWLVRHCDRNIDGEALAELAASVADAPELGLSVAGCRRLSGTALASLGQLSALRWLDLFDTHTDDSTVAALANLPRLESLHLASTPISPAVVDILAGMRLHTLHLGWTALHGAGLGGLAGLTGLRRLSVRGNRLTEAGLGAVAALPAIEHLDLQDTGIDDAALEQLMPLGKSLRTLDLGYTRITAQAGEVLRTFPRLHTVIARGTRAGGMQLDLAAPQDNQTRTGLVF